VGHRQRSRFDPLLERATGHIADGEVVAAFYLAGVEYRNEMLVPDFACAPRLVEEPACVDVVIAELELHHLERDDLPVALTARTEDLRHPAFPEHVLDVVGA